MKEVKFETIYTSETISERINKLIDSESMFDTDKTVKPFSGYCNVCKFEMLFPSKAYQNDLVPKYIIQGFITNYGNIREVSFIIRKSLSSYLGTFFMFIVYAIGSITGPKIVFLKFGFLISGLIGYCISMKISNKNDFNTEMIITEQIVKSIISN